MTPKPPARRAKKGRAKPVKAWKQYHLLVSICPNCGGSGRIRSEWYTCGDTNPVTPRKEARRGK